MSLDNEFDVINHYFKVPAPAGILGVGDDCALLPLSLGCKLAVSTDMLIEGRHFLPDTDPSTLGHKALAVNLSDLAAMGAKPVGCTLSLALPEINHAWLSGFSASFHNLSKSSNCPLVGGDTTRSLSGITISVTVMGEVRRNHALRRSNARVGDDIWVTGSLGGAYIALLLFQQKIQNNTGLLDKLRHYMETPQARIALGVKLAGIANAAIDISDGLLQDLGHILEASSCGAEVWLDKLPLAPEISDINAEMRKTALLAGGDAYELCFTARPRRREQILALAEKCDLAITNIGTIIKNKECVVLNAAGNKIEHELKGFDHFAK